MVKIRKKPSYRTLHYPSDNRQFLAKVNDWRDRISSLSEEMRAEHKDLSDVPIRDLSTAVLYQEFLITAINFLQRANEMLAEYQEAREGKFNEEEQKRNNE